MGNFTIITIILVLLIILLISFIVLFLVSVQGLIKYGQCPNCKSRHLRLIGNSSFVVCDSCRKVSFLEEVIKHDD